MTKDEQIKMLKEQRAALRASNEKFRNEFMDKACKWLKEHQHIGSPEQIGHVYFTTYCTLGRDLIDEFRKAMAGKTNPLFKKCLSEVNPETRAEVSKNMDLANLLTWRDVRLLVKIADEMIGDDCPDYPEYLETDEKYYSEVLKRFNSREQ